MTTLSELKNAHDTALNDYVHAAAPDFNAIFAKMPSLKVESFSGTTDFHWSPAYGGNGIVIPRFSIAPDEIGAFIEFLATLKEPVKTEEHPDA